MKYGSEWLSTPDIFLALRATLNQTWPFLWSLRNTTTAAEDMVKMADEGGNRGRSPWLVC